MAKGMPKNCVHEVTCTPSKHCGKTEGKDKPRSLDFDKFSSRPTARKASRKAGKRRPSWRMLRKQTMPSSTNHKLHKPERPARNGGSSPDASHWSRNLPHTFAKTRLNSKGEWQPPWTQPRVMVWVQVFPKAENWRTWWVIKKSRNRALVAWLTWKYRTSSPWTAACWRESKAALTSTLRYTYWSRNMQLRMSMCLAIHTASATWPPLLPPIISGWLGQAATTRAVAILAANLVKHSVKTMGLTCFGSVTTGTLANNNTKPWKATDWTLSGKQSKSWRARCKASAPPGTCITPWRKSLDIPVIPVVFPGFNLRTWAWISGRPGRISTESIRECQGKASRGSGGAPEKREAKKAWRESTAHCTDPVALMRCCRPPCFWQVLCKAWRAFQSPHAARRHKSCLHCLRHSLRRAKMLRDNSQRSAGSAVTLRTRHKSLMRALSLYDSRTVFRLDWDARCTRDWNESKPSWRQCRWKSWMPRIRGSRPKTWYLPTGRNCTCRRPETGTRTWTNKSCDTKTWSTPKPSLASHL